MKTYTDEIAGVLTDPDFDDDQKVEVVQMLVDSEQNPHICTPEENMAILRDLAAQAGIDWDAPVEPKPVLTAADLGAIEKVVASQIKSTPPPVVSESRYWSIDRAAQECAVSKRTFSDWLAAGKIRYYQPNHRVLIDPVELKEDLTKFRRQRVWRRRNTNV